MSETKKLQFSQVNESSVKLRNVDEGSEKFLGIVDSIREKGIINNPVVRLMEDGSYELCDGHHRFAAMKVLGMKEADFTIRTGEDDSSALELQIMANIHRIETKPVDYSKALCKHLAKNPQITKAELAKSLAKSVTWLDERLNLKGLAEQLNDVVNNGMIPLSVAVMLAKLPEAEQLEFEEQARSSAAGEVIEAIKERIASNKKANTTGRAVDTEFVYVPHLRALQVLKSEATAGCPTVKDLCAKFGVTTVDGAIEMATQWMLNGDPEALAKAKAEFEARKAKTAEDAAKRLEARKAKIQADAAAANAALENLKK